jgi:hypothetical protein
MIVWMMRSSTPLKKEISAVAVLTMQIGVTECNEVGIVVSRTVGSSLTGTIVSLFSDIRIAPPCIDKSILPGDAELLYALFDYGLT